MFLARSIPIVIILMTFPFRGLDENDYLHLGTFDAVCDNFAAASGRGSPFHSLDPLMPYQYGQMFELLGVSNMGRQGSGWCGIDPNGVMVLMSHQNFFHPRQGGGWYYDAPGDRRLPTISASAARSIRMLAAYFQPGREILLPVGRFRTDGQIRTDGTHEPAAFVEATGAVYRATMREFEANTGRIVCDVVSKYEV